MGKLTAKAKSAATVLRTSDFFRARKRGLKRTALSTLSQPARLNQPGPHELDSPVHCAQKSGEKTGLGAAGAVQSHEKAGI